jgi:hypothetical protein
MIFALPAFAGPGSFRSEALKAVKYLDNGLHV